MCVVGDGVIVVSGLVCFLYGLVLVCRLWLVVFDPDRAGVVVVRAFHVASPFAGGSHVLLGQFVMLEQGAFVDEPFLSFVPGVEVFAPGGALGVVDPGEPVGEFFELLAGLQSWMAGQGPVLVLRCTCTRQR